MILKRLLALSLCLCLLASCQGAASSEPDDLQKFPMDFSVAEQSDVEFKFQNLEDSVYTMIYEPRSDALVTGDLGLCMPAGLESDWSSDTDTTSNYVIYDGDTKVVYATVTVQTAPADPLSYYNVTTAEEVLHEMLPNYFPMESFHEGLRKNIVDDFGYSLLINWAGTAYGAPACYMEFVDVDSKTHSMRFYLCNDSINEYFYAFIVRVDVPMNDAALIEKMRGVLFSLHMFDTPSQPAGEAAASSATS